MTDRRTLYNCGARGKRDGGERVSECEGRNSEWNGTREREKRGEKKQFRAPDTIESGRLFGDLCVSRLSNGPRSNYRNSRTERGPNE